MQLIDMVSRPSLPAKERMTAMTNRNSQARKLALRPNDDSRECVPRQRVVLDAFDKIILVDDDQNQSPM